MDSPENSGFDEVNRTLAMGWDVDGLETATGSGAQQADGTWGSYCFTGAKGLGGLSLGANTEG